MRDTAEMSLFKQIRTKKKFEAAVTLDSIILKKLYGDHYYKTIIDCLIKARYIERVGNHIKGYKSTSYKITAALIENGFEIVALTPSNTAAGTVAVINASTTKTVSFGGKTRITQKSGGTSLNNWSFHWTAPSTNVGNVTFYLGTNTTNSNRVTALIKKP